MPGEEEFKAKWALLGPWTWVAAGDRGFPKAQKLLTPTWVSFLSHVFCPCWAWIEANPGWGKTRGLEMILGRALRSAFVQVAHCPEGETATEAW